MTEDEIRRQRARAQLLHRPDLGGVTETVRRLLAVQAQDVSAYPLALRARIGGLSRHAITKAREDREIVRTYGPRGTLHLIATEDLPWLFPLVRSTPANSVRRLKELGVPIDPDDAAERAARALEGRGPLTKAELGERLGLEGQAIVHMAMLGARKGLVVLGPDRSGKATYVHAADWLGTPVPTITDREKAVNELVVRYNKAHHPAEPADLAAWSGLPLREITTAWRPGSADRTEESPVLRLVPAYDEYLLGYKSRSFTGSESLGRGLIHPGGGVIRAAVIRDGMVIGTWRLNRGTPEIETAEEVALADEIDDVRRFLS